MLTARYALIIRDGQALLLTVVTTHREPRTGTRHNGVAPSFLHFCSSVFALHPNAASIETVSLESWCPGVDVGTLSPVLWVEKTEAALTYSFPLEGINE